MKRNFLVICGPTATGKTRLGFSLAKRFNGEIISADSRQVYKGMNIGTGKDLPAGARRLKAGYYWIEGVRLWGLDLVEPNQPFSAAHYARFSQRVIRDIWSRKKLPILVGGTGFYTKALIDGIQTLGILPDWELRWRLKNWSASRLFNLLVRLDSNKAALMNFSDRQNCRRLIRAIEVSQKKKEKKAGLKKLGIENLLIIGLRTPNKILYQKINKRIKKRVQQGIKDEIRKLLKKGFNWRNSVMGQTLGYQEWEPYFAEKLSQEEVIRRWQFDEHGYARRQLTWFKKDSRINWFDLTEKGWQVKIKRLVQDWLSS